MPNHKKLTTVKENTSTLYWLFAALATGMVSVILYYLLRNLSDSGLDNVKSEKYSGRGNPLAFFPSLPCKEGECVKFAYHESFNDKKSRLIVNKYIDAQKKILASLPLTLANRAALAKATIYLVPTTPLRSGATGFIERMDQISVVMHEYLNEQSLRQTLLNEIHHLTVMEINRHKLEDNWDDFSSGKIVGFPFLTKDGKISIVLKGQLEKALLQIKTKVSEFDSLLKKLKKKKLSGTEEKKLSVYLAAMDDYVPTAYSYPLDINLFRSIDRRQNVEIKLTLDTGQEVYGKPIYNDKRGEVLALYSINRDRTPLELAKAFIYDFNKRGERSDTIYTSSYKREERAGSLRDYLLIEIASDMDEMLTPKLKKVFAPLFMDYFDRYAEPYLQSEFVPSLSRSARP